MARQAVLGDFSAQAPTFREDLENDVKTLSQNLATTFFKKKGVLALAELDRCKEECARRLASLLNQLQALLREALIAVFGKDYDEESAVGAKRRETESLRLDSDIDEALANQARDDAALAGISDSSYSAPEDRPKLPQNESVARINKEEKKDFQRDLAGYSRAIGQRNKIKIRESIARNHTTIAGLAFFFEEYEPRCYLFPASLQCHRKLPYDNSRVSGGKYFRAHLSAQIIIFIIVALSP